jgi:hypothetical protein
VILPITEVEPGQLIRMKVGTRHIRISVARVVDIGQNMVNVYYRNSEVPYRVPTDTQVTVLG